MKKIKMLELFGGIGSPRIALRSIGIDVKAIEFIFGVKSEDVLKEYEEMWVSDDGRN